MGVNNKRDYDNNTTYSDEVGMPRFSHRAKHILVKMVAAVALISACALLSTVVGVPWGFGGHGHHAHLNPYTDGRKLTFKNGKFKLVLFSDLHYGEREGLEWVEWGVEQDTKSTAVMDKALTDENPDFVVFGGDQITGENQLWENSTVFIDQILTPVKDHNVPFATIYGNHDESYNISHTSSYWYEKKKSVGKDLSWTQANEDSSGDPKGIFNYYIPVYADKRAKVPALLLWFFDSRSGVFNGQYHEDDDPWTTRDWVDPKAASWINSTAATMREEWGSLPKSLAFVHIPPTLAQVIANNSVGANHTGINLDIPVNTQGEKGADGPNRDADLPFWHAVTGTLGGEDGSGLVAITSGHDHGNDWCERDEDNVGPYSFCFARHTGYGGYGNWARGSRVFEAVLDNRSKTSLGSVKTWIRIEDHSTANTTVLVDHGATTLVNTGQPVE